MIFPQNRSLIYYVESGYRPANRHTFLSWTGLRLRSNKFKFIYVVDRCCVPSLVVQTCSRDPLQPNTTQKHQCKHQHLHHTPLLLQIRTPPLGTTVTLATRWPPCFLLNHDTRWCGKKSETVCTRLLHPLWWCKAAAGTHYSQT